MWNVLFVTCLQMKIIIIYIFNVLSLNPCGNCPLRFYIRSFIFRMSWNYAIGSWNHRETSTSFTLTLTVICYVLRTIWKRRNLILFQQQQNPIPVDWAYCEVQILEQLKLRNWKINSGDEKTIHWFVSHNIPFSRLNTNISWINWKPPSPSLLKLNLDGTKCDQRMGVAFVLRNHDGLPLMASQKKLFSNSILTSNQIEMNALSWSIQQVMSLYHDKIIIVGDSQLPIHTMLHQNREGMFGVGTMTFLNSSPQ